MPGDVLDDWEWKSNSACVDGWTGVKCEKDRVTVLDLSGFGLSGYLSDKLSEMSALETVKLDGNSFDGTLPESWGKILTLKHLNLSSNAIGGKIVHFLPHRYPFRPFRCPSIRMEEPSGIRRARHFTQSVIWGAAF